MLSRAVPGGKWHLTYNGLDTAVCGRPLAFSGPRSPLSRIGESATCKQCATGLKRSIDTEIEILVRIRQEIR